MRILTAVLACLLAAPALAGPADGILASYLNEARRAEPGLAGFSAERGGAFFAARPSGGQPDTPSCTACHGETPRSTGRTKAGKEIGPLAASMDPSRYADPDKVEKWFGRNCQSVLGRACTAREKGDFIAFMLTQ